MIDANQCSICTKIGRSWYGKTWAKLAKMYSESATFRDEWQKAADRYNSGDKEWETALSVRTMNRVGMTVEALYWFMKSVHFSKRHGLEPKAVGLKLVKIRDEDGQKMMSGVLLRPEEGESPPADVRVVRFWYETVQLCDEEVMDSGNRLREEEPMQTFERVSLDKQQKRPKDFTRG